MLLSRSATEPVALPGTSHARTGRRTATRPRRSHAVAYALLVLTMLFWSGNFVVGRALQAEMPPVAMAFWRWVIALAVLLPFSARAVARDFQVIRREWKILLLLGALSVGLFNTLVYVGLGSTTATNGILLNSAIPVLIVVLGWLFAGERLSAARAAGVFVSLAGVVTILFHGSLAELRALRVNPGDLWVFAAMLSWAVYSRLLARRPAGLSAISFLAATVAVGCALNLPLYAVELAAGHRAQLSAAGLAALGYLGVFPSVLAYLFWNRAVAEVGPSRAGAFLHLMPAFGTLLAVMLLGEAFRAFHAVGIAFIVGGVVLSTRR